MKILKITWDEIETLIEKEYKITKIKIKEHYGSEENTVTTPHWIEGEVKE